MLAGGVNAQGTAPEVIVVTATRSEHDIRTTPAPIQLIDTAEIESMGAVTLRDVMELAAGAYVSPGGTDLQIRGLGHSDTVYLLNGRRLKGEFSNSYELERIPSSMIERIEILRGPSSLLYGADALGGVVNIITRRPVAHRSGGADLQVGANDRGDGRRSALSADYGDGSERLRYIVYASASDRQPYAESEVSQVTVAQSGTQLPPSKHPNLRVRDIRDEYAARVDYRDDAQLRTLGGTLEWRLAPDLRLGADLNYLEEEREGRYISSRYASAVVLNGRAVQAAGIPALQHDDNRRLDTAVGLDWRLADALDLRYQFHYGRYDKDRAVYALPYEDLGYASQADSVSSINRSRFDQQVHEFGAVWRPRAGHTVVAGIEQRRNETDSTAYDAETRRFRSAFVQHDWRLAPQLDAVYGVRHDDDSVGGSRFSGQAGAVWSLSPLLRLRANVAQGFKSPDDRTLYVDQVNPSGVPMLGAAVIAPDKGKAGAHALVPETSDTVEVGAAGAHEGWRYALSLFRTTIAHRIEQVREGSGTLGYNTFRNIGRARIDGIEAEATWPLAPTLRLRAAFTALDARNDDSGERLLNTPERLASLALDFAPTERWNLQAIVRHVGDQDYAGSAATETADGYTLLHLKANYRPLEFPGLEIHGGVNNLFDAAIDPVLGSDPGPYAYLGLRYRF